METGRKILNLRRDLGFAQKTLVNLSSVTPSALSRIEAGTHQPRATVALRLARELGVTVDYLLDDTAPYPPPEREIVANLPAAQAPEKPGERLDVTRGEKRVLLALRSLDSERRQLLSAILAAPRARVHAALTALGSGKPRKKRVARRSRR